VHPRLRLGLAGVAALMVAVTAHAQCQESRILLPDGEAGDNFGSALASDGDRFIASAAGYGDSRTAFVMRWDGAEWVIEGQLNRPDPVNNDYFPTAVAIEGPIAVASARWDQSHVWRGGAVFVYRFTDGQWELETRLSSPVPIANEAFGDAVAIDDGRVLVAGNRHSAYLFEQSEGHWIATELMAHGTEAACAGRPGGRHLRPGSRATGSSSAR